MPATSTSTARRLTTALAALALLAPLPAAAVHAAPAPDYDATPFWAQKPFYTEQDLAVPGVGGFPNYRIPALAVTNDGTLLASYDGRPTAADSPGPNSILQRVSHDGGDTWEPQTFIHEGDPTVPIEGYSDPSYLVDRETGHIFNFHVKSFDAGFISSRPGSDPDDRKVIQAEVSVSTDNGVTWEQYIAVRAHAHVNSATQGIDAIARQYGVEAGQWDAAYAGWTQRVTAAPPLAAQFGWDLDKAQKVLRG